MNYKARNQKNGYIKEENGNIVNFTLNKDGNPEIPQKVITLEKGRPRFLNYCDYYYDENDKLELFKEADRNEYWTTKVTESFYMDEDTTISHIETQEIIHGDSVNITRIERGKNYLENVITKVVKVKGELIDYHQANFWHYEDSTIKMKAEILRNKHREETKVSEFKANGDIENEGRFITSNDKRLEVSNSKYCYDEQGRLKQIIITSQQGSEKLTP